ncbi:MAG: uncharacterized protein JWM91_2595, partial [Rhodospirillales bacterium]|nr:uncharacterized protein [Rhodospirillales bacterium]
VRSGFSVRLIAPPTDSTTLLGPMPADVVVQSSGHRPFDAVILVVPTTETLTARTAEAAGAFKPGGLLWLACPKTTGAGASDMSRECAWEAFAAQNYRPVSQLAIDNTWSALQFRPSADVKSGRAI